VKRRRVIAVTLPALGLAAAGAIVATSLGTGGGSGGARAAAASRGGTATVARRTLVDRQRIDGTLGYAGKRTAANRLSGTITWLPRTGAVSRPGRTLFKVDGTPVVLMDGTLPAYRSLAAGVDDGDDVRQLERGLARLGYDPGLVDDHYSSSTAAAVKRWQKAIGVETTGRVELGRVVFLPGARRVTDVKVALGSSASGGGGADNPNSKFASYTPESGPNLDDGNLPSPETPKKKKKPKANDKKAKNEPRSSRPQSTPAADDSSSDDSTGDASAPSTEVLETTSTRRVVTAKVDVADQTLVAKGRLVRVELPDGRTVPGRITSVGTVATSDDSNSDQPGGGDSTPTISITIRLKSAKAAGRLDQAPVSVQIARTTKRHVLAVPVQALVARPGGRYALERADGRLVTVTPGVFAGGYVEIAAGAIHEGDRVRVPR
jgi:hypothetical protein